MKLDKILAITCLLVLTMLGQANQAQDKSQPITKQEIIALLKNTDQRNLSQSEVVDEVERRGIAFKADAATLSELRQNGARVFLLEAIKRLSDNGGKLPVVPAEIEDEAEREKANADAFDKLPFIEKTRRRALEYSAELPNFIVTQHVNRYLQMPDSKDWKLDDTLEVELRFSPTEGEQFKVIKVNGKATQKSYDDIGGTTSSGEFGSLLASIFSRQSKAEFKEIKKEVFNKREAVIYDFTVKKVNSNSAITDRQSGKKAIAGYSGSIWIDIETQQVLRIESANEGMPADFPITLSENAVEYDWMMIDGQRYLLPVRAELLLGRDREKFYMRNVIEFRNYQKFEAKIKIE
jgi:hypothetical protein